MLVETWRSFGATFVAQATIRAMSVSNYEEHSCPDLYCPLRVLMKYFLAQALTLFFISLSTWAQVSSPPQEGSAAENTYSVNGSVTNVVTGEPVSRALVQIFSSPPQNTFSDSSGRFEFDGLRPGVFAVTARKPNFSSPEEAEGIPEQPGVTVGPATSPLVLKLVPMGVIFGRAQKPDGEAIRNLPILLAYYRVSEGRKRWDLMNNSITNEEGEFRISNLRPGRYYLAAGPSSRSAWIGDPGSRAQEAGYPMVFYPGVSDWTAATPLDVSPGQQAEAIFSLAPQPTFRVSGTLAGVPPQQHWAQLEISPRGVDIQPVSINQEADGSFDAKVPAGSYTIRATSYSAQGNFYGETPVTVRSDLAGVNVVVTPALKLPVEITLQRTRPLPANSSRRPTNRVSLRFHGQAAKFPTPDYGFAIGMDKNSEHNIHDIVPGTYSVDVRAEDPDLYVDSVQCGGTDLLRDNFILGAGTTTPIQVVLRDDGGTLRGNIVSGARSPGTTVLIVPDRAPRQVFAVNVGAASQFQYGKLAPGDYSVLAFDRVSGLEYMNPDILDSYRSYATHASVTPNGDTSVSVNLIRTVK
jgi:hypothetical protein